MEPLKYDFIDPYQSIVEKSHIPMFIINEKSKFISFNDKLITKLSYSSDVLTSLSILDIVSTDYFKKMYKFTSELEKNPRNYYHLKTCINKTNNETLWVELLFSKLDQNNSKAVYLVVLLDRTKNIEQENNWKRYEFLINNSKERMSLINRDYIYEVVNDTYCIGSNKAREEIIGKTIVEVWGKKRAYKFIKKCLDECFSGKEIYDFAWFEFASNDKRCFEIIYYPYFNENNLVTHALVISRDVTLRKQAEEELKKSEKRYRTLFENSQDVIYLTTPDKVIYDINKAGVKLFSYSHDEMLGLKLEKLFFNNEDWIKFKDTLEKEDVVNGFAVDMKRRNDSIVQCLLTSSTQFDENHCLVGYQGIIKNISHLKSAEKKLHFLAYHDSLTGLANRTLFNERINQAVLNASRTNGMVALMLIDLDNFKKVNDTYGHPVGDQLLKTTAYRLQNLFRETDTVARLSGDEFAIIITNVNNPKTVAKIASKIIKNVSTSLTIDKYEMFITCCVGIALYPIDGTNKTVLMQKSDIAMYYSKNSGKNEYQFYSEEINSKTREHMTIIIELYKVLKNKELELYYQPQFDCKTNKIVGMEALLRWNSPKYGLILPNVFIPLAEESGFIVAIGEWTLRNACRQLASWHKQGYNNLTIAVNLSAVQFRQKNLVKRIKKILADEHIDGKFLELEITESVIMKNVDTTIKYLNELKAMGIKIAIDDFGTGYSSLNYLKKFPIDTLKIDKIFLKNIDKDIDNKAIVTAIISLGHDLSLNIVAEGIENKNQLNYLVNKDCNNGQGYFFSHPLNLSESDDFLKKTKTA